VPGPWAKVALVRAAGAVEEVEAVVEAALTERWWAC